MEYAFSQIQLNTLSLISIVLIVVGVAVATFQPLSFSIIGSCLGLGQSFVQTAVLLSFRYFQQLLSVSSPQLLYYSSPVAAVFIFCSFPYMKLNEISWSASDIVAIISSCLLAAVIQITSVYVVAMAHATSYMMLTNGKTILIVLSSFVAFNESTPKSSLVGAVIAIFGLILYGKTRNQKDENTRLCSPPSVFTEIIFRDSLNIQENFPTNSSDIPKKK